MRKSESPSSCSLYDLCPAKYKFKYIDKLPDPSGPAAELGTKFHNSVYETWNGTRVCAHSDPQINAMLRALYSYPKVQELPAAKSLTSTVFGETRTGIGEHCIDVPCRKGRIFGFIDLMLEDGSLADLKTSKSVFSDDKRDEQRQHLFYVYGALKMGWITEDAFPHTFRYIVVTTTKNPLVQVLTFKVTREVLQEFEQDFDLRLIKIQLSDNTGLYPHNVGPHCRYCPFRNVCPAHISIPYPTPNAND